MSCDIIKHLSATNRKENIMQLNPKILLSAAAAAIHLVAFAVEAPKPPRRIFDETDAQRAERM